MLLLTSTSMACADPPLKPLSLEQFFVDPVASVSLHWTGGPAGAAQLTYLVTDYAGKQVASGQIPVADGAVDVSLNLGPGFYEIAFKETGQAFGICALPAYKGQPDPFFGIDAGLSWLSVPAVHDELIGILARCGIGIARERLFWGELSPTSSTWNWNQRYTPVRDLYAKHDVKVLELFHDAPRWSGSDDQHRYPQDLIGVANAWAGIGAKYGPAWGALEVWNEPDLGGFSGASTMEQYPPIVKAVAYGFARAKMNTPIGGGVFSNPSDRTLQLAALNGLLDNLDFLSFHSYYGPAAIETQVKRYRDWVKVNGRETLPLWITECGTPSKRGPQRPPVDEDSTSALGITMAAIEARACGVARHFPFVYPFYEENVSSFGMMGKENTPERSMVAYAEAIQVLANRPYLGDLKGVPSTVQRARVFGGDPDSVIVVYTGKAQPDAAVKLSIRVDHLQGIDGRALAIENDGSVPVPDGLTYVWLRKADLRGKLLTDTLAARLYAVARKPAAKRPDPSPIILSYPAGVSGTPGVTPTAQGYVVSPETARQFPVKIRISNLSTEPHKVQLAWYSIGKGAPGKPVAGPAVDVPASGTADAAWTADLGADVVGAGRGFLAVTASDGLSKVSPLALPVLLTATLETALPSYKARAAISLNAPAKWDKNITGDGKMEITTTPEGHWLLNVSFGAGDPWVYPRQQMHPGFFTGKLAVIIRARCMKPGSVKIIIWEKGGAGYLTTFDIIPADGQWHTAILNFSDFALLYGTSDADGKLDLDQVDRFSVGMNSNAKQNTLEVSDLYVVGG